MRQKTIRPIIAATVAEGTRVHTDESASYARLEAWGYRHVTVCHARGEYALAFVHNVRRRGKALLGALVSALVA